MELDILRIDLDIPNKKDSIKLLKQRLSYLNDLGLLYFNRNIDKIILIKKTSYACKIFLKKKLSCERDIIILQLLLGSDYMKETNTLINHFKLKMIYSNRLFDCKRYKGGVIKHSIKTDVTSIIKNYINAKNRKKNYC